MRVWKGPWVDPKLRELVQLVLKNGIENQKAAIKTQCRSSIILPEFIGLRFAVHNGKSYEPLEVKDMHVGYRFGQFVFTRATPRSVFEADLQKSLALAAMRAKKK